MTTEKWLYRSGEECAKEWKPSTAPAYVAPVASPELETAMRAARLRAREREKAWAAKEEAEMWADLAIRTQRERVRELGHGGKFSGVELDKLRKLHRSMDFNPPGSGFPIYLYFTRWGLVKFKVGLFWIGVREFFRKRKACVRDRLDGSYRAQRERAKLRDIME